MCKASIKPQIQSIMMTGNKTPCLHYKRKLALKTKESFEVDPLTQ